MQFKVARNFFYRRGDRLCADRGMCSLWVIPLDTFPSGQFSFPPWDPWTYALSDSFKDAPIFFSGIYIVHYHCLLSAYSLYS